MARNSTPTRTHTCHRREWNILLTSSFSVDLITWDQCHIILDEFHANKDKYSNDNNNDNNQKGNNDNNNVNDRNNNSNTNSNNNNADNNINDNNNCKKGVISVVNGDCVDVAAELQQQGHNPLVLIMANRYW